MNPRKTSVLALMMIATLPSPSQAHESSAVAIDACVKSFSETYLAGHRVRGVRKRSPAESPVAAHYGQRQYTIALSAHGATSGDLIAQARCVVSREGAVLVLDSPPSVEYVSRADFRVGLR
ncbi:MAG TPA: hypothetical protein VIT67_22840 [Povalibacter sp.]|jgi:hypothetical protein